MSSSLTEDYAVQLKARSSRLWKRLLDVQAPYRWNLRRLRAGYVLDLGCGFGRNLAHLDGRGVGVDANPGCVALARAAGLVAYDVDAFASSPEAKTGTFDTLLVSHVIEHVGLEAGAALVGDYLRYLKPGGRVVLITPQEAGYAADHTHVEFINDGKLHALAARLGLAVDRSYAFPFPRFVGRLFRYNEFVVTARLPEG